MKQALLIIVAVFILSACRKEKKPVVAPVPPPGLVLLKDISYSSLPSPFYHFEYDANWRINKFSFSSALGQYNVSYAENGISNIEKTNATNHDKLIYTYESIGKPSVVEYTYSNGEVYERCFITYSGNQLSKMEWEVKPTTIGFINLRELSFTYYDDGNLKDVTGHGFAIDGVQEEYTYTEHYENYDNKKNTDDFAIYQTPNDHTLLLPGIKLQQNNPGKVIRTGAPFSFEITYAYTYNNDYPVNRTGNLKITSGTDTGKQFTLTAGYTYY